MTGSPEHGESEAMSEDILIHLRDVTKTYRRGARRSRCSGTWTSRCPAGTSSP